MKFSSNGLILLGFVSQSNGISLNGPINFEDEERQDHTDRVIENLKNQVFNHYHHNSTELNNDIRSDPSNNHNDKEYSHSTQYSHSQIYSDPCTGLGCDTFNVPNYPPEPPKEGRIGEYQGGKWIIPVTPLTTPNNLVQSDPCSGFGCDTFNVPNYPPEAPKKGRLGSYQGGKWIIPATPLTTPNNLFQK